MNKSLTYFLSSIHFLTLQKVAVWTAKMGPILVKFKKFSIRKAQVEVV